MDIRATRIKLGLSQAKAAALVRVPLRTWENWETEKRKIKPYTENMITDFLNSNRKLLTTELEFRELRKQYNVTRKQFEEITGIPANCLRRWEENKSTPPKYLELLVKDKFLKKL